MNYISFMHNFETCLESTDNSRNLQLLIQHRKGKAREAVQSCVNLPVSEGYQTAKKLKDLAPLKNESGQVLLEFQDNLKSLTVH